MGKRSFNFGLITDPARKAGNTAKKVGSFLREPINMAFGGFIALIVGGGAWAINEDYQNRKDYNDKIAQNAQVRAEEQRQQRYYRQRVALQNNLMSGEFNGRSYILVDTDTVKIDGPDLVRHFDFSMGRVFVIDKENSEADDDMDFESYEFSDIPRQEFIAETRQAGCTIANQILDFPEDNDLQPTDLEGAQNIAHAYLDLNCGVN